MANEIDYTKIDTAFIIVDVQKDFIEGGALAVAGGKAIIPIINKAVDDLKTRTLVITTQDWHPIDHSQFVTFGGPWPVHCVAGTAGAELADELVVPPDAVRVLKGMDRTQNGYSGFDGFATDKAGNSVSLGDVLKNRGITRAYVCGIATDYCVHATVMDAIKQGIKVIWLENGCVGVAPDTTKTAVAEMIENHVILMRTY